MPYITKTGSSAIIQLSMGISKLDDIELSPTPKPRTRLRELKNAWSKASPIEQREFLSWLRASKMVALSAKVSAPHLSPVAADRYLVPLAVARIEEIISKRHLMLGDVMAEMSFLHSMRPWELR
ncbi:hypothetical protein [Ochrobactrum sp. RH2CCR150]|uniref:hypothetical protein n=1 Tax=Ochrobactrum sp. RH2CCR150 TaxID=2587044 RepID=UPI0015FAB821|nr:hypothetical protein [Ochrobactrum sp. RH2CCR150]